MDPSQARTQCAFATLLYRHYHSPEVAERHFKQALELDEFVWLPTPLEPLCFFQAAILLIFF